MIRQNALAHFLFRHAVEPVVLLPLFVRLGALLGLRELRSEKKRRRDGRDNTTLNSVFMPRHSIQRDARSRGSLYSLVKPDCSLSIGKGDHARRDSPRSLFIESHRELTLAARLGHS